MPGSPRYDTALTGSFTDVWLAILERQKAFAEHAMRQLTDSDFFRRPAITPGASPNSVAVIVRHLTGNMRSRWTDFLTTDGEKPGRRRESEFADPDPTPESRAQIMTDWEAAWRLTLVTIAALTPNDLTRTVNIRGKPHTVQAAVVRQIDHYATHVGQIITTARLFVPEAQWRYFTIPPGRSEQLNEDLRN